MASLEPSRRPGRPSRAASVNGSMPSAPPARPPTATEQVAAIEEKRATAFFLVQPPLPLALLNRILPPGGFGGGEEAAAHENDKLIAALNTWLRQTADAGFPEDLWRVWKAWTPATEQSKHALRTLFDDLIFEGQRREMELRAQVEQEAHWPNQVRILQARLTQLEKSIAAEEKHLKPMRDQAANLRAAIAKAKAKVAEQQEAA